MIKIVKFDKKTIKALRDVKRKQVEKCLRKLLDILYTCENEYIGYIDTLRKNNINMIENQINIPVGVYILEKLKIEFHAVFFVIKHVIKDIPNIILIPEIFTEYTCDCISCKYQCMINTPMEDFNERIVYDIGTYITTRSFTMNQSIEDNLNLLQKKENRTEKEDHEIVLLTTFKEYILQINKPLNDYTKKALKCSIKETDDERLKSYKIPVCDVYGCYGIVFYINEKYCDAHRKQVE